MTSTNASSGANAPQKLSLDKKRVAVISDLHANGTALTAVLSHVSNVGVDAVVMLGDLLGYGPDVEACCVQIESLRDSVELHTISGNHDQIYIELEKGASPYLERLPTWLKESSLWTASAIEGSLSKRFDWKRSVRIGNVHFDHANPFEEVSKGVPDWTYLNDDMQIQKAAKILWDDGATAGVFGHNHRELLAIATQQSVLRHARTLSFDVQKTNDAVFVLNPGTVGQPRSNESRATYLLLSDEHAQMQFVDYDARTHIQKIRTQMNVSEQTQDKLIGYFERAKA